MVDLILGLLAVGIALLFLFMSDSPPRKPVAYWKIVLVTIVVTFGWTMFRHDFSLGAALDAWPGSAVGLSVGFCLAEAARRYRDKRKAA